MVLRRLRQLLELIRFSHTVFALPFALFAAVLAWSLPDSTFHWRDALGILLCMVTARSAAMAFNRIADRHYDALNPRTAQRHLPAGLIPLRSVIAFTATCSLAFVASTLLFLPKHLPVLLSVPFLLFLLGYSYAKRFTNWCHYWLSAALMLAPIGAWIAIRNELAWPPVLLAGVVFFWVGGFDIIYACQDCDFDRSHRLHSLPARWGIRRALQIALLSHVCMLACLVGLWYVAGLGLLFLSGVVAIAGLLAYEHWLVRPDDLSRLNVAFFQVNAVISFGLLIVGSCDILLQAA